MRGSGKTRPSPTALDTIIFEAPEGTFFGFGGAEASDAEKATVSDIATALGVPGARSVSADDGREPGLSRCSRWARSIDASGIVTPLWQGGDECPVYVDCWRSIAARRQYRLRRSGMLRRCHPSRMPAHLNNDRKRQTGGSHPCFQMGQYRVGQYQSRPRGDLPSRARKTRPSISRGVRISIQSQIRPQNHDPPPRIRCAEDRPDALPPAKTG